MDGEIALVKFIRQLIIILAFSFAGEWLNRLLPVPVPASIYGLLLLFAALATRVITVDDIRESAYFLIALMPVLFVAPFVNLTDIWAIIEPYLLSVSLLIVLSTLLTFGVAGMVTQSILKRKSEGAQHE